MFTDFCDVQLSLIPLSVCIFVSLETWSVNPLIAKLENLNFDSPEVVLCYGDPQFLVGENFSY